MNEIDKKLKVNVYVIFFLLLIISTIFIVSIIYELRFFDLIKLCIAKLIKYKASIKNNTNMLFMFLKFIFLLSSPIILLLIIFIAYIKTNFK